MHPRTNPILLLAGLLVVGWMGMGLPAVGQAKAGKTPATEPERPAAWAQPMELEGVPNLFQLNPRIYRSAQPAAEGMKNLQRAGIQTIINLRVFHSDREELADSGLGYVRIAMKTWHPEVEEVVSFLRVVADPDRAPVLVHCQHGSDRTGTLCAIYRIAVEGWTKQEAIREMTEGGFGFHPVWRNLPRWIEALDIEAVKEAAGIPAPAAAAGGNGD